MKILLYEQEGKHENSIAPHVATAARMHTEKPVVIANTREQAISELEKHNYDLVFVHHGDDFEHTVELKKQFPETTFAGYHGALGSHFADYKKGNFASEFVNKFYEHYEHVVQSLFHLPSLISKIKDKKNS